MKIKSPPHTELVARRLIDLLQTFIRLHPNLVMPEHIVRFKQQMEKLRGSGNSEDGTFLMRVFIVLANSESPLTMGELSAALKIPLSSATRIVDWLVRGRFLERSYDPNDRRVVLVKMTRNGEQFFQTAMEYNKQRIAHLMEKFSSEEQDQLLHLMSKLLNKLQEESSR
ncbi:MAG TPA: MarR family transcriptional regulator [Anaerolineales bacterium]|nr:MarR family transcriptional regulator [Anaerolineales bacterium]